MTTAKTSFFSHACRVCRFGADQPMWISPVRDLTSKDLAMVSHYKGLKTVPAVATPSYNSQPSINALAEQLIATLSISMPSTVHAILGTACKLVVSHPSLSHGMHGDHIILSASLTFIYLSLPLPHTHKAYPSCIIFACLTTKLQTCNDDTTALTSMCVCKTFLHEATEIRHCHFIPRP